MEKRKSLLAIVFSCACMFALAFFLYHCGEQNGGAGVQCADLDGDGYPATGINCPGSMTAAAPWGETITDCDDTDPDNWVSCDTCLDGDTDGWFVDCDAYTTRNGPDCDDEDPNNWSSCDTCTDEDGDGYKGTGCDVPEDCDDTNPDINPAATEICDGVDNDCDPGTADGSGETPPLNSKQDGVCADSTQSCTAGDWQDDYSGVQNYEDPEATCDDNLDNDCDGLTDGGDSDCSS